MTGEIIKSFLVGLGFDVDDASLAKFNKSIDSAAVKVTALYAAIKLSAAGIFAGIAHISDGFEQMGYQLRLVAPAINKMLILRQAMLSAYQAAGINLTKVVKQSILFNYSLAKTKFALEAVYKSVAAKFFPLITKQMDVFRMKIFANMPKIQAALIKFVNIIFKAFDATVELGTRVWSILGRVWDFFKELDTATNGWSTKVLEFIAIWKAFNLEFIATPVGAVLTGLLAILALYDDFKVWQEGGKSFFNWSSFIPVIDAVKNSLSGLADVWRSIVDVMGNVILAFYQLFHSDSRGFFESLANAGRAVVSVFQNIGDTIFKMANILATLAQWAPGALGSVFGGKGSAPQVNQVMQPQPLVHPGAQNNQKVSQETNITVQGSADAQATSRAVASEQGRVNFDMTRNLKGAMQ